MKKTKRESSLIVRMSDEELKAIDQFANLWEVEHGVSLTRSKIMRNALAEYMAKYDYEQCVLSGNVIEVRINPDECNTFDLLGIAEDMKAAQAKASTLGEHHLYKQIIELLMQAFTIERNAKAFLHHFNFGSKQGFYKYWYKQEGRLLANLWNEKEAQR